MNLSDIVSLRLQNQHLIGEKLKNPQQVVAQLGAVQAQDFAAGKWGIGQRIKDATDEDIERAFNDGLILRTHVMRPTWHFVLPSEIRSMLALTAPRVKKFLAHYDRKLELDPPFLSRCNRIFTKVLEDGNFRTRSELATELEKNNIIAKGQRLGHIVAYAELDALICSGPRRGKQFTYALLEERAPKVKRVPHDEALGKLALTYFTSHGPAQIKDFAWWAGLTIKDATAGLHSIKSKLQDETLDFKTYWFSHTETIVKEPLHTVHLLSIYDEYVIAYKDRNALGGGRYVEKFIAMGNALTSVLLLDGLLVGTWKKSIKKDHVQITISPMRKLQKLERESIEREIKYYGKFLSLSTKCNI